jgi:hypothetical protein
MEIKSVEVQMTNGYKFNPRPIKTLGEVFADGHFIEPVRDPVDQDRLALMLFNGASAEIAARVEHRGGVYEPRDVAPSIVRELHLPTEIHADGSEAQLVEDLAQLIQRFTGLPENSARLAARIPISTWVMDALPAAPTVLLLGPDSCELNQLFSLLQVLCRHAFRLTEVGASGLYSLPMEMGLTLLIDQEEYSEPLQRILNASRKRETKVPRSGNLWNPFCSKVVHVPDYLQASMIGAVRIPIVPTGRALPVLDDRELSRIANDFQPRLLWHRIANYRQVQTSKFDISICDFALRETINGFAACTPQNAELQAEICGLVADQSAELRHERSTDARVVVVESLLLSCHTPGEDAPYIGKVADAAKTLLSARGEEKDLKPNQVGAMIRHLGLKTERRDSQGVKLLLTSAVRRTIHELARNFAVPSIEHRVAGCTDCEALEKTEEQIPESSEAENFEGE